MHVSSPKFNMSMIKGCVGGVEVEPKLDNHSHKWGLIDMLVKTKRKARSHMGGTR
jgi:hypothetical protein